MEIRAAIARVAGRHSLREPEIEAVMRQIMDGGVTPAQIGGLLVGLRMKGETVDEITGAARAMRACAVPVAARRADIVDTCGTGGDQAGTFNISTAAAFIAAGAGVCIAKHGNRAMSGAVGGADVLEELGVRIDLPASRVAACIDEVGFGFLFAPLFHQAMRHVAGPRRELGVRTIFNLLGPLSNPAGARRQVVGVFAPQWTEPLARALGRLGCEHALVVHGDDGLDEISLTSPTRVSEWRDGGVRSYQVCPEQFGFQRCAAADLSCGDKSQAAAIVRDVVRGNSGPRTDISVLNAAAAVHVAGLAPSLEAAVPLARESVHSGRAALKLAQFVEFSNA